MFGLKLIHCNIKYQKNDVIFTECKYENCIPSQPAFLRQEVYPVPLAPGKIRGWLDSQLVSLDAWNPGNLGKTFSGAILVDPREICSSDP